MGRGGKGKKGDEVRLHKPCWLHLSWGLHSLIILCVCVCVCINKRSYWSRDKLNPEEDTAVQSPKPNWLRGYVVGNPFRDEVIDNVTISTLEKASRLKFESRKNFSRIRMPFCVRRIKCLSCNIPHPEEDIAVGSRKPKRRIFRNMLQITKYRKWFLIKIRWRRLKEGDFCWPTALI
jgi:hypothetical protein